MSELLKARRGGSLRGLARIGGDKSCSHRALILAAMAEGETFVNGLSDCEDVQRTVAALFAFGCTIEPQGDGWRVRSGPWASPDTQIDCGNSGTTARLLMGAVAGMEGVSATFAGDASLAKRPMRRVSEPLRRMGAEIDEGDTLPLSITGRRLGGIDHQNVPASAQVKSALLLAGLSTDAPVRIVEPIQSRDHSEIMLAEFGATVVREDGSVELGECRELRGTTIEIGADPSSAAYPILGAAIVPGSDVTVLGMNVNPLRTGFVEQLERMSAGLQLSNESVKSGEIVADVRVRHSPMQSCHVTSELVPAMIDEIPALAVACAFADGESVIEGLGELRVKESDRLGALVAGLTACGVAAVVRDDSLHIFGRGSVRGGATVSTHGDHRIAMAFLTLGLASEEPVTIDRAEMIATSFPGFVEVMRGLGADIA